LKISVIDKIKNSEVFVERIIFRLTQISNKQLVLRSCLEVKKLEEEVKVYLENKNLLIERLGLKNNLMKSF